MPIRRVIAQVPPHLFPDEVEARAARVCQRYGVKVLQSRVLQGPERVRLVLFIPEGRIEPDKLLRFMAKHSRAEWKPQCPDLSRVVSPPSSERTRFTT